MANSLKHLHNITIRGSISNGHLAASPSVQEEPIIHGLRSRFKNRMIVPGDAGYDQARMVIYGGIDRRPAVIVRAADTSDVSLVVSLARG